jgi:hypothetical protein
MMSGRSGKGRDRLGVLSIIRGAAGRDFHRFDAIFRDGPASDAVASTAAPMPNIEKRHPPERDGSSPVIIPRSVDRHRFIPRCEPALRVGQEFHGSGRPNLKDAARNF